MIYFTLLTLVLLLTIIAIGFWWRFRSLACPANVSWLLENRYMNTLAGADSILSRLKITHGMRVVDVGCGPGRLTIPAARLVGPEGEVVGLDLQQKMLDKLSARALQAQLTNIRPIHAAAGSGALPEAQFDRALLVTVLGEISDKQAALAEIHHALRADGILSITELIPDPHYTSHKRIQQLAIASGFEEVAYFGNWLCFTVHLKKAPISS